LSFYRFLETFFVDGGPYLVLSNALDEPSHAVFVRKGVPIDVANYPLGFVGQSDRQGLTVNIDVIIGRLCCWLRFDAAGPGRRVQRQDQVQSQPQNQSGGEANKSTKTGNGRRRDADDLEPKPGHSARFKAFRPGDDSDILRRDRAVTLGTTEFLKNRKVTDKPFFLFAGYLAPHFPLIVPEKYWAPYKGRVPIPTIPEGHLESQPRNYKHLRIAFNVEDAPPGIVRKGRELYYGLTQWLDEEIGKVFKTLAESEVADNTIVIYTTDHGENMGEHGLWWKNCVYEHAAHVPLIVSWPQRWNGGQRRTGACSLVDVVQTIAELGGAKVPDDWNGDSMVPWMDDAKTKWKDLAVSEYYAHNIASGYAMIRMGRYKYVYHTPADENHPAERELYDLQTDPSEFTNLAHHTEHKERLKAMHKALVKEISEDPDKTELRCRKDYARGYGRDIIKKKKTERQPVSI
jgi:choline-sulfatase